MEDNRYGYGTSVETEIDTQTDYQQYEQAETQFEPYKDDYSVTPNYEEQQSYESKTQEEEMTEQATTYRKLDAPIVKREESTVVLTKTVQKMQLSARMKIVASVFSIIMACLVFVTIWNFVSVSRLNQVVQDRQVTINELYQDISRYENSYNEVSDVDYFESQGFTEANESNTKFRTRDELYEEPTTNEIPSNWFNDLGEFFSKIFG